MSKINEEEYELLISIVFYWKWIARDRDGRLHKFHGKPEKVGSFRWNDRKQTRLGMSSDRFQFIQWGDENPYNVTELIEEYGSEETGVKKDKQWAISELTKTMNFSKAAARNGFSIEYFYGKELGTREAIQILKKLDEPETFEQTIHLLESILKENKRLGELLEEKHEEWLELMDEINNRETETLTPEWIDDNSVYASSDGVTEEYVHVDDLKELIVPKQEVLSQKWIDENKSLINGRSTNPDGTEGKCYDAHYIHVLELQNLLVPKQEEVDRVNKGGEPETVADVVANFYEACERLQGVMSMEVEGLEK